MFKWMNYNMVNWLPLQTLQTHINCEKVSYFDLKGKISFLDWLFEKVYCVIHIQYDIIVKMYQIRHMDACVTQSD